MRFRPCIDIHNGKVKQIVGGSLTDTDDKASENFVSGKDAAYYAKLYEKDSLVGGHVIMLNPVSSSYYEATKQQALQALGAAPGTLQIGGGIKPENAEGFLNAGASHVIVTSYVFSDGQINWDHLEEMVKCVGPEHLVLDLSCRKKADAYYIVTDRWQKYTDVKLDRKLLDELSRSCDEFLVHAVDAEGMAKGPETEVVRLLGQWQGKPMTYAGGISSYEDIARIRELGEGHLDITVGSALDLFGGSLEYKRLCKL